ncbi:translation initiation factor [Synechococcales cyanobacterium C]|uniref:Translation initiation factor n=1 Tax=Petrachloros mirabilis ULC683 TaxID=2781853 RepID=A0A8K1ZY38_9CYAN|nr:translation initiation factor [Petrachloros mirabilis]NCJ07304.1 translation initiation factor [Petrachloros mirabilis ULC683]
MGKSTRRTHDQLAYREFGESSPATTRPDPPPNQQNLTIQASRKGRKGKTVTVISGFQVQPATLSRLAKTLKSQCGSGGTAKDNKIEIQGDHRQMLVQVLSGLGYAVKVSGG